MLQQSNDMSLDSGDCLALCLDAGMLSHMLAKSYNQSRVY